MEYLQTWAQAQAQGVEGKRRNKKCEERICVWVLHAKLLWGGPGHYFISKVQHIETRGVQASDVAMEFAKATNHNW